MGHKNEKYAGFSCFAQGRWVVAGSEDSDVFLWDLGKKEVVGLLVGHEEAVVGVDSWGGWIATGGLEGEVKVWWDVNYTG